MRLKYLFRRRQTRKVDCSSFYDSKLKTDSELFIIQQVQQEAYSDEIENLRNGKSIANNSKVLRLDHFLDENVNLRMGGRLKHSHMSLGEKHPILLSGQHYIAKLIVLHFHENIRHQGRHLTDGAIRAAGY